MRDYWVVTLNWDVDFESEYKVLGVYLSEQVAKKEFKKLKFTALILMIKYSCFDTGRAGTYYHNHICVSLRKVTNRKWGRKTD